ncbi:MAG: hypothetical protein OEV44_13885, partial [Spirochaetota bacterium]|nr:hypothetical protein [Spirochaetota bacterium]
MKILRLLVITIFIVIISHLSWSKNLRTDINSFPNWTKNIIFINVKKLQPMINKYIPNKIFSNRDYIEIKRNFGIDPIKNVTKIYIGFSEIVNNKKPKFVILIHVKFNQNKIMNFIKQEGIANLQIEKLYKHPILSSASEKNFKIALINGKYIIISSYNEMKEIISLIHGKGKSINKNKGLMRELRINKKNNLFWCRFHYNNLLKEEVNNILNRSAKHKSLIKYWITKLSDINEIISSIHKKNNQIKVTIKGVTKNRSSIKELFIMLNTIKQFVYSDVIYNKNLSEIKNLIENIKITNKRNSFNINLSFTNEDISKIINYIKQQFPVSQRKQDDEKEKYIPFLRNEYWAKGKAEYQLYNHKILWYGKIRESKDSFMLIVSEQWDNKKNVKSGVNWNAEILKFSIFDIFKTGTYPYSFKSDIYFNIKNGEIVKYTMSCQVPSGTNFFRFDKRGKRGIFTWHSFWDDHGLI